MTRKRSQLARAETSIQNSGYAMARLESSQNALEFCLRRGYVRWGPPDAEGAYPLRKDLTAVVSDTGLQSTVFGDG